MSSGEGVDASLARPRTGSIMRSLLVRCVVVAVGATCFSQATFGQTGREDEIRAGYQILRKLAVEAVRQGKLPNCSAPAKFYRCNKGHYHWSLPSIGALDDDQSAGGYAMRGRLQIELIWKALPDEHDRRAWTPAITEASKEIVSYLIRVDSADAETVVSEGLKLDLTLRSLFQSAANEYAANHNLVAFEGDEGSKEPHPCNAPGFLNMTISTRQGVGADYIEWATAGRVWRLTARSESANEAFEAVQPGNQKAVYVGAWYYYRLIVNGRRTPAALVIIQPEDVTNGLRLSVPAGDVDVLR